jgi:nitroreductase
MDLREAIATRRAVRSYTAEPVDEARLRDLIGLAVKAPSAMNRQPWAFCVIRDRAVLQRISEEAKRHLLEAPAQTFPHGMAEMLSNPDFQIFYHAPALVLITGLADDPWARIDCALAAENLMLAAADAGLGSCWIGFAQAWLETDAGKALVGLSADRTPIAPIIVGHPASIPPEVPRTEPAITWIG